MVGATPFAHRLCSRFRRVRVAWNFSVICLWALKSTLAFSGVTGQIVYVSHHDHDVWCCKEACFKGCYGIETWHRCFLFWLCREYTWPCFVLPSLGSHAALAFDVFVGLVWVRSAETCNLRLRWNNCLYPAAWLQGWPWPGGVTRLAATLASHPKGQAEYAFGVRYCAAVVIL